MLGKLAIARDLNFRCHLTRETGEVLAKTRPKGLCVRFAQTVDSAELLAAGFQNCMYMCRAVDT